MEIYRTGVGRCWKRVGLILEEGRLGKARE